MKTLSLRTIGSLLLLTAVLISGSVSALAVTDDDGSIFEDKTSGAVWEVVGPMGGDVRAVAIDPKDPDRIYISTLDGQIHRSTDAGKSWQLLVNLNEPLLVIDNLRVDRLDSNRIYAAGNRGNEAGGFFYSTDAGNHGRKPKSSKIRRSIRSLKRTMIRRSCLLELGSAYFGRKIRAKIGSASNPRPRRST